MMNSPMDSAPMEAAQNASLDTREQSIYDILESAIRVACKGFAVGGSLYVGLEFLSSVSSKRIFTRCWKHG